MKRVIVPALPSERIQYERWYQLGLPTLTTAAQQLRLQQHQCATPISWFPQFTVRCQAPHADQRLAAVRQAISELRVQPTTVTITAAWFDLTFALQPAPATVPVWLATDGGLWRLYDGLLSNLVQTSIQPLTQIQVGLSSFEADQYPTKKIRPNFSQYAAVTPRLMVLTTPADAVDKPACHAMGKLYQL